MTTQAPDGIETAIPDLRDIPADKLAELGGTVLARSIAEYRERLKEGGEPLSSFQAHLTPSGSAPQGRRH